jgi:hypothetical protein
MSDVARVGFDRLRSGERWELRVRSGLQARGWDVELFGTELLTDAARAWLQATPTALRWLPDLIARRGVDVIAIDPKYGGLGNHDAHTIETASVRAGLGFERWTGLPELFVFPDGCVCPPEIANRYGTEGRFRGKGSGTPFLLVPCAKCLRVENVFGRVSDE